MEVHEPWVVISPLIWVMTIVILLITLLVATLVHKNETLLFTIDLYYGNLNEVP